MLNRLRPYGRLDEGVTRFEGNLGRLKYRGNLAEHIDRTIFYFGSYSPNELDFLQAAAARIGQDHAVTFFDIGANVGQHSLWMSQFVDRVIAFEPSARAARQFRDNLAVNQIDNVTLFEVALGEADYQAQLGSGFEHNSGSRSLMWSFDQAKSETVEVRAADRFFEDQQLPPIDLLKLDVEGYEALVLGALADRLRRDRPVILMELLGEADNMSGFKSEADLRAALYPDVVLFSLAEDHRWRLRPFNWAPQELACIPAEKAHLFQNAKP